MTDLVKIMADGSVRAMVLHSDVKPSDDQVIKLRDIIKSDWPVFADTLKDALEAHMGDAMYKTIMNTFCNAWAVKALAS